MKIALGVAAGVLATILLLAQAPVKNEPLTVGESIRFGTAFTHATSTVNTTSTQVLAANSARQYARIQNLSDNNLFCYLDNQTQASSTIVANAGFLISPSSTANSFLELGPDTRLNATVSANCVGSAASLISTITH